MISRKAKVITVGGEVRTVQLPSEMSERLAHLQEIVGGYLAALPLPNGNYIVVNEDHRHGPHTINDLATAIALSAEVIKERDYIAGPAMIVPGAAL